ncbi:fibropellin-1-like isoform X1, partial [Paramuricea clavata]
VPSLKTNIIAESRETSYEFCGLKCAENRFCVAVNYKKKAGWNESNCQLTNSTARKFDNISSEKERVWTFIKVNVDRSQVASCRGEVNECQNGGTMIWHSVKTFGCLCGKGYEGEICEKDIDECSNKLANECDINANCTNTAGSYNCQCHIGWSGKGKNCSDIDECCEGNFTCHPNATCINTQGSYNCQCKNGLVGDGKENCTDSFLKSVILSGELNDHRLLRSWIGQTVTAKLCWRATRDGWATSTFHSKCDYKKPTVTIIKVGEFTFGGFATASWEGEM